MVDKLFFNMIILDVRANLLTSLGNSLFSKLKQLKILNIDKNPIASINLAFFNNLKLLWVFNFIELDILKNKIIVLGSQINGTFHIIIDDILFCCYFKKHVRCVADYYRSCYKIIERKAILFSTSFLTGLSMLISVFYTVTQSIFMLKRRKKNALISTLVNIGISEILICVYLSIILIANHNSTNIVYCKQEWSVNHYKLW